MEDTAERQFTFNGSMSRPTVSLPSGPYPYDRFGLRLRRSIQSSENFPKPGSGHRQKRGAARANSAACSSKIIETLQCSRTVHYRNRLNGEKWSDEEIVFKALPQQRIWAGRGENR